jgi:hypothetical protein
MAEQQAFDSLTAVTTVRSTAILQAMENTKPGTLGKVPGFIGNWLPSTDSNRGPSG